MGIKGCSNASVMKPAVIWSGQTQLGALDHVCSGFKVPPRNRRNDGFAMNSELQECSGLDFPKPRC